MELKNSEDLDKFLTICRKKGVESIKIGEVSIKFAEAPVSQYKKKKAEVDAIEAEGLSLDDLIDWSSAGHVPEVKS